MERNGHTRILSVGYYLPGTIVKSSELISELNPDRLGIKSSIVADTVGVEEMRHAASTEKPSDLAIQAALKALEKTDINRDCIDVIIFCGVERDYTEPSTAHRVQAGLGLKGTCFDVSNACLGFVTAMQLGNAMIAAKMARYVLVCTGEKLSTLSYLVIDELKEKPDISILRKKLGFLTVGDAGGAVILGPKDGCAGGFVSFRSTSLGEYAEYCYYNIEQGRLNGQMIMEKICASGIRAHKDIYGDSLAELGWQSDTIDCLITHQVGRKPFSKFSQIFRVGENRMTRTYHHLGNIATATFPVNLAIGMETGLIKSGDRLFAAMSGSGLAICQAGMIV